MKPSTSSWPSIRKDPALVHYFTSASQKPLAATCVAALLTVTNMAFADTPSITPGQYSVTIPYTNTNGSQLTASPELAVGFDGNPSHMFTMDTGSTGIIVGTNRFDTTGKTPIGSGSQTYTSSGIVLSGDFYMASVKIGTDASYAIAQVPILVATSQTCLPNARNCTASNNPQPAMFGVGFGQEAASQPDGIPSHNAFLNIVNINGTAVTPGAPGSPGNLTSGYIVTSTGVTLGLTAANTQGFNLVPLVWNDTHNSSSDWNRAPATLTIAGYTGIGTVLADTGVPSMYVTPPQGSNVPTTGTTVLCLYAPCAAAGVSVVVDIGLPGSPIASYSFTIGTDGGPVAGSTLAAPEFVTVDPAAPDTFVNTTYHFFNAFNYAYDYVDGVVGIQAVPEPPALTWMGGALLVLPGLRRWRRRTT